MLSLIPLFALLLLSQAEPHGSMQRVHKRQIDVLPAPVASPSASTPVSRVSSAPAASSAAPPTVVASSVVTTPVSSAASVPASTAPERTTAQPVTVTATTPTSAAVASSSAVVSSTPRFTTSTATVPPTATGSVNTMPTLPLPSATSEASNNSSGSGSLSKPTLIAIIVVASVIALIAAIWTIIRKTKFSPSKKFESKLEPIDFIPSGHVGENHATRTESYGTGHGGSQEKLSAGMAGYGSSRGYEDSLERSDSEKSRADTSYGYTQSSGNQSYQNYPQQHQGYAPDPAQYGGYSDLQRGPSAPASNHRGYPMNNNNGGYYQPQQSRY